MNLRLFSFCACVIAAYGHGYLEEPPARNSMWRAGFDTPKNYNDMGLNCGGFSMQWNNFGGKCGICGDPYNANPGDHEVGGKFVNVERPLGRCYNKADSFIDISVRITSHHKGYFEFYLCENNNKAVDPNIDCFDKGHLLTIAGTGGSTRYSINNVVEPTYSFQLDMPRGVTCTQCILRWKYNAGNNYGCDETGCALGLGPQEQFINCADIAILPDCSDPSVTSGPVVTDEPIETDQPSTDGLTTESMTTENPFETSEPSTDMFTTDFMSTENPFETDLPTTDRLSTESFTTSFPLTDDPIIGGLCRAIGIYENAAGMDTWCVDNCFHIPPYCPESICECGEDDDDYD